MLSFTTKSNYSMQTNTCSRKQMENVLYFFNLTSKNIFGHQVFANHLSTVKPLITNSSEEFIKCRLDNFSMSINK